jgi:hypothetical protein
MSSSSSADTTSKLLSKTNEILTSLTRLNSNVQLYSHVHSLQQNLNTLEENFKSLQSNVTTSTCNSQCKALNSIIDPNGVDDFLIQLLLSKSKINSGPVVPAIENMALPPIMTSFPNASAPPFDLQ